MLRQDLIAVSWQWAIGDEVNAIFQLRIIVRVATCGRNKFPNFPDNLSASYTKQSKLPTNHTCNCNSFPRQIYRLKNSQESIYFSWQDKYYDISLTWRLFSTTWNPRTSLSVKQLMWLRIVHAAQTDAAHSVVHARKEAMSSENTYSRHPAQDARPAYGWKSSFPFHFHPTSLWSPNP